MPRLPAAASPTALRGVAAAGALAALAASAALAYPAAARAQVPVTVTFGAFASPVTTEYQATVGRPVTANGFDFFAYRGSSRNVLGTWGTDPARDPDGALNVPANAGGATALYGTQAGDIIDMFVAGQIFNPVLRFDLFAIDVAHLYSQAYLPFGQVLQPITLTFFGFQTAGANANVSQTFTIGVPGSGVPSLTSLAFDSRWRNLLQVAWQQPAALGQQHQFTNVRAAVVPEPGTWALVGVGLAAVGGAAARRRRPDAGRDATA